MLNSVLPLGSNAPASAAANALIRAVTNGGGPRGPSASRAVRPSEPAGGIRGKSELTPEERQQVQKLKQRDQEVRRHEAAHKAAAGSLAKGGASFEYTTGPDGRRYATGGEVQIDTSASSGDPRETIQKMEQVRRAALSPAEPSAQDQKVAAEAAATEAKARAELARQRRESGPGVAGGADGVGGSGGTGLLADPIQEQKVNADNSGNVSFSLAPGASVPGRFIDVFV